MLLSRLLVLKMESSDMRDDEYKGGPSSRPVSKVNYPTYLPTKAPFQVDKPTTLQPRGGSYLPQPWLGVYGGWIHLVGFYVNTDVLYVV